MIVGVGFQTVEIDHIARLLEQNPEMSDIFSSDELLDLADSSLQRKEASIAARFALKKAAVQSLHELEVDIDERSIHFKKETDGSFRLSIDPTFMFKAHGGEITLLGSISHSGNRAVAAVVAQSGKERT